MGHLEFIKIGTRVLLAKIKKQRIPFQVYIRALDQCNQNCTYCKGDYPRENQSKPTTQQLFELIDGLASLGTKRITLFGGEPLLREDIYEVVQRIKKHRISCSLTTNGCLIDRHIGALKDLDFLAVSLDGNKQINDTYRGEGSYNAAIHAVQVARDLGVSVQLLVTITNLTDLSLSNIRAIAEKYNCSIAFDVLNPIFYPDGSVNLRSEDIGQRRLHEFIDWQLKYRDLRIVDSPQILRYIHSWPESFYRTFRVFKDRIPAGFIPIKCYGGVFYAIIEANGDLFPCCIPRPDYKPVNAFDLGIEKAWNKMPQNKCLARRTVGNNMLNALFDFKFRSLFYFLKREAYARSDF